MTRKRKSEAGPDVELPITPMLDMAFQLLTFFIFTYHPSALEGQIEVALPGKKEVGAVSTKTPLEKPTDDDKIEQETQLIVEIEAGETGLVRSISLGGVEGADTAKFDDIKEMESRLEQLKKLDKLTNREGVRIKGAENLQWGEYVKVMDRCKQAGFTNIGLGGPANAKQGENK